MNSRFLTISFYLLLGLSCKAQAQDKSDYTWMFSSDPSPLPNIEGSFIDFRNDTRDTFYQQVNYELGSDNAQICDKNTGKLLFYSNGCVVVDSTHQLMENGDDINPGELHGDCILGYDAVHSAIILPDPGYEFGYYLIHKRDYIVEDSIVGFRIKADLLYSYIDMSLNNGLGKVTKKNIPLLLGLDLLNGYMTGCKHVNGKDWWFIQMESFTNNYYIFLLDSTGINFIKTINIGPFFSDFSSSSGQAVFSPDGSKYLLFNVYDDILIYDFDRVTGSISNLKKIIIEEDSTSPNIWSGVAISSNSRFAYLSAGFDLYQLDLWAENIANSLVHIDHYDFFIDLVPTNFMLAKLAPDCKIYITSTNGGPWLHVINSPNEKGKACDFRQHSFKLPHAKGGGSIPNYPHFRIDETEICDSSIVWVNNFSIEDKTYVNIYPNPAIDLVTIEFSEPLQNIECIVYDIYGAVVLFKSQLGIQKNISLNIEKLISGIYIVEIKELVNSKYWATKMVVNKK